MHHLQSQRFLSKTFSVQDGDSVDPPLRSIVEQLADGDIRMRDLFARRHEDEQVRSFLGWVSAFRLVA